MSSSTITGIRGNNCMAKFKENYKLMTEYTSTVMDKKAIDLQRGNGEEPGDC